MQFIVIDPKSATVEVVQAEQLNDVYERVGLVGGQVDHASVHRFENGETINIVVYEFGLYKPPDAGRYFSIGSRLYEGGAVLYAADAMGETVSIAVKPPVMFYRSSAEVEQAITRGEVNRPVVTDGKEVIWKWPHPRRPF